MLGGRLVRLIEDHSAQLARNVVLKLQTSPRTRDYRDLPAGELRDTIREVYCHLGDWLLFKTEIEIEARFTRIGARRAVQGISWIQFVWAVIAVKEELWTFLQREAFVDQPVELFCERDLLYAMEQFFDRAMYYASIGYAQGYCELDGASRLPMPERWRRMAV